MHAACQILLSHVISEEQTQAVRVAGQALPPPQFSFLISILSSLVI